MQQTENYQLNLIDADDPFSPEALNENAQKLDEILHGQLQVAYGTYTGTGESGPQKPSRLEFPFKPLVVIIADSKKYERGGIPWIRGAAEGAVYLISSYYPGVSLTWEDHAVQWNYLNTKNPEYQLNAAGVNYLYVAFGFFD